MVLARALTYAGEAIGEQGTQLGLGLGAAALGTLAAPVAAPVLGAAAPFVVGATAAGLATAPILFGNNIQRQEDEVAAGKKDRVDVGDALTATFGQAALEGVADKLLLGGFKLLKPVGSTKEGWKGVLTRTGSRATGGAGTESLTEVGQQMLERAQAGLPIDSDDAIAEYREAAIAGGLIGGGTRATLGAFGEGRSTVPTVASDAPKEVSAPTPTVIDDEVLNNLGVLKNSPFRQKVLGKPIADKDTQELLQNYAKNTIIRNQQPDLAAKIEALINGQPELKDGGAGASISGSGDGLGESGDGSDTGGDSDKPSTSDTDALGTDLPDVDESGGPAGSEPNTLDKFLSVSTDSFDRIRYALNSDDEYAAQTIAEAIKEAEGKEYNYETANKVELADVRKGIYDKTQEFLKDQPEEMTVYRIGTTPKGEVKSFTTNPEFGKTFSTQLPWVDGEGDLQAFKVKKADILGSPDITARGPIGENEVIINVDNVTPTTIPKTEDVTEPISNTKVRTDPKTLEPIGEPFEAGDEQVVEGVEKPILKAPPRVQGAPKSQEELQAMEDLSNQEAQAKLDVLFEDGRRSAQAQEYHDTEINALSAPEVTTAVDKEGIIELLTTPDAALKGNNQAEAAKNFFKRFRRPVDALAEIGAVAVIGSNQTNKLDYVKAYNLREDGTPIKTAEELKDADMTRDFSFYNGITQPEAMDARRWVHENMSRGAVNEMIEALRLASRNTYKANVIDAPNKNEKAMKKLEDTSVEKIVDDIIVEETVTEATENDITGKPLDKSMAVDSVPSLVNNRMGHTTTESLLVNQGFEKTKVRSNAKLDPAMATRTDTNGNRFVYKDTRNEGEFLSQEDYNIVHDGVVYTKKEMGLFLLDPVHGLDQALLPSIQNALQRGDLQFALNAISATNPVKRVRQIAGKLAETVGTTQVQVVDDLSTMVGRKAAGMFRPATNTVFIDANNGMNVHTVLHEMAHAVTSASLANPNLPEVKQLQVAS